MTNCKLPLGLPITLESVLQALDNRDWLKIAHNTWLIRKDGVEASVKFYLNEIVRFHQDGSYTLWGKGADSAAVCKRLSEFAPVEVFMHHGEMRMRPIGAPSGGHVEFYDGVRVDRRGLPIDANAMAACE